MKEYTNPAPFVDGKRYTNPDPYVLRWCGRYYCYATDAAGVKISVSENLIEWADKGYALKEANHINFWAPAVFYQNGIFYMYYSNANVNELEDEDGHRIYLKLATADNPLGPFEYRKTFFDKFSIDAHPQFWNGKLYLFYSVNDWVGTDPDKAGTCILLDGINKPDELEGSPEAVVLPEIAQEIFQENRFGDGRDWYTIEGACTLKHGGYTWLLYSANAYINEDYFVGYCVAENKAEFRDMKWKKQPVDGIYVPLLCRNELFEGTGHNTVTKAPNLLEDWIVYHSRLACEELIEGSEQREMHINPVYYNGKRLLCPGLSQKYIKEPAQPAFVLRDKTLSNKQIFDNTNNPYYIVELWISGQKNHTGMRFGIYLDYQDERNYLELQFHSGHRTYSVISCHNGLTEKLLNTPVKGEYDYTAAHQYHLCRRGMEFSIEIDEIQILSFAYQRNREIGKVGIVPYFSALNVHSFVYTIAAELVGSELRNITDFYDIPYGALDDEGLSGKGLKLVPKQRDAYYLEEFLIKPLTSDNDFTWNIGKETLFQIQDQQEEYTVYIQCAGDERWLLANGEQIVVPKEYDSSSVIYMQNLKILEYRYVKN